MSEGKKAQFTVVVLQVNSERRQTEKINSNESTKTEKSIPRLKFRKRHKKGSDITVKPYKGDTIEDLLKSVEETENIMKCNVETMINEREKRLDQMLEASENLEEAAEKFQVQANKVKKKYMCKYYCPCCYCCVGCCLNTKKPK
ncbi:uncharacterized protein LOC120346342 [Styela clava]|uniref:uncharacterized protein LOC120346342 n=1 Tax=Styela clava TaxID=7725 RepID=UPI00193A4342|nr:uncharacterized protein LOC120346342 [Styela clava]